MDREDKITPLHIAVQFPDIGLAKKLVEAKANVHSTTIGDRRVKKKSNNRGTLRLLTLDLRFPDFPERHTPLHKAALCCNYQALEVLIGAGADVNAADKVSRGGTDRAGVRWLFFLLPCLKQDTPHC